MRKYRGRRRQRYSCRSAGREDVVERTAVDGGLDAWSSTNRARTAHGCPRHWLPLHAPIAGQRGRGPPAQTRVTIGRRRLNLGPRGQTPCAQHDWTEPSDTCSPSNPCHCSCTQQATRAAIPISYRAARSILLTRTCDGLSEDISKSKGSRPHAKAAVDMQACMHADAGKAMAVSRQLYMGGPCRLGVHHLTGTCTAHDQCCARAVAAAMADGTRGCQGLPSSNACSQRPPALDQRAHNTRQAARGTLTCR